MTGYIERLSHVERQQSSAALWCYRFAVFAIPYFLIVVLGHRFGAIDTVSTLWLLGLGVAILVAALIAGIRGFFELWFFGHKGGLSSARGIALGVILLLPFVYMAGKALVLPPLYDISTDLDDPPAFEVVLDDRTEEMNPVLDPTSVTSRLQLGAYPRISARRYPLAIGRVFREVVALVGARDWTILTASVEQGNAPIDQDGSGLVAKAVADSRGRPLRIPIPKFRGYKSEKSAAGSKPFETEEVAATGREANGEEDEQEERYVEAVATSFIFGFESDIVVRMIEEDEGTLVDVRSVSRWGPHDFGSNAARILAFTADLDTALQGLGQGN